MVAAAAAGLWRSVRPAGSTSDGRESVDQRAVRVVALFLSCIDIRWDYGAAAEVVLDAQSRGWAAVVAAECSTLCGRFQGWRGTDSALEPA